MIRTLAELEALYGTPNEASTAMYDPHVVAQIAIDTVFFQCARAVVRAKTLW